MKSYLTETEILQQAVSLSKVLSHVEDHSSAFISFLETHGNGRIFTIGCGSGFCLAQAASRMIEQLLDRPCTPLAGGDLFLNQASYYDRIRGSLLIIFSRSGSTSELVQSVKHFQEIDSVTVVSILAKEGSALEALSDFSVILPDSFDESVCQTRTVTSFYTAFLYLCAHAAGDKDLQNMLREQIDTMRNDVPRFHDLFAHRTDLHNFSNAVLLADEVPFGLADEGAMAIREMACLQAATYHVLDVRHGPMALIDSDTLVVHLQSDNGLDHQAKLLTELKSQGSIIISVGPKPGIGETADVWISTEKTHPSIISAVPFIVVIQCLAFFRAISRGFNPDNPPNLSAWVSI